MVSYRILISTLLLHVCSGFANIELALSSTHCSWRRSTSLESNKSVNHGSGDYHYNQQPRGTSFISQVSKRDLEERRQMRPPFQPQPQPQQWQQTLPYVQNQQPETPAQAAPQPQPQAQNSMKEFDSISANIKAMTSLLGDVKESLTAQTSDIRWLNQKYQEIEKRLERTEIFNTAISQDVSEMKTDKQNSQRQSRFGPIYGEREPEQLKEEATHTNFKVQSHDQEDKARLHEKLDGIKEQMDRLNIAIKVGEVTLSSHMEDVNKKFDSLRSASGVGGGAARTTDENKQFNQPSSNDMNRQFNDPWQNNMSQQPNQPQQNTANQQYQFQQPQASNNMYSSFNQPPDNVISSQFSQPQPPPFAPVQPFPTEPNQPHPSSFQKAPFQMGSFRYEGPRPGISYEIPSSRQTIQSQSSANYNNQRRNKSFISSISERELAQRRELFEPVAPMSFLDESREYFDEYDDFYPEDPFLDEGGYFDGEFF